MKLISLNTWGGRGGKENLLKFFAKHQNVDFLCLQEVWSKWWNLEGKVAGGVAELKDMVWELLSEIGKVLPGHASYFRPSYYDCFGLATFVKKDKKVIEEGETFVYKEKGYRGNVDEGDHSRNIQWLKVNTGDKLITIINFHGLWNNQGKRDSRDRLLQSDNIVNFLGKLSTQCVLTGDFNLRPDTESIKRLEKFGLRNLITENNVISTRTNLYTKTSEKFADYTFVSRDLEVKNFQVLPDVVSDHAPLSLEFE